MPGTTVARAIVVDPRPLFGEGMRACLSKGGHLMLGQALNLEAARQQVDALQPDLVIVGPHLAESGLAICRDLTNRLPTLKIILFATHTDDPLFQADAANAGVATCLPPETTDEECLAAIVQVIEGREFFSREIVALGAQPIELSERELEVLRLLAEGKTDREIADALGVQVSTIRSHAQHILEKLSVHTRQEAAKRARNRGLV
jgi:DNA-binding NarL/FixJ family response regulator